MSKITDNSFCRTFVAVFRIKPEERWLAAVLLTIFVALDALVVAHYYDIFTPLTDRYWRLFIGKFHISGFDPITYSVVSDWTAGYNVYRHPLLAYFMYVPYLVNQALMWLTGINCALFIVTAIQLFCSFYSAMFIFRIFREVIGLAHLHSVLLTFFFFSFAFVMLTTMVPDHFVISMMLLLLALYVSGKLILKGRRLTLWQAVFYFFLTAGTSLNNGLKVFLCDLFVNAKSFFRPKFLFGAIIVPAALIWGVSRMSYACLVWPNEMAVKKARAKAKAEKEAKQKALQLAQAKADSIRIAAGDTTVKAAAPQPAKPKRRRITKGRPIVHGEFMDWTDATTSRFEPVVENLFGESIQLHKDHLLGDLLISRPVIVHYRSPLNYVVEATVVLLFAIGIWCGRRSRFFWLAMSFFALDMVLHVGLGFALNEIYIMTAHWIYIIPIAVGYMLKALPRRWSLGATALVMLLTVFLWVWNVSLIIEYLV